jgi:hypothetical protein
LSNDKITRKFSKVKSDKESNICYVLSVIAILFCQGWGANPGFFFIFMNCSLSLPLSQSNFPGNSYSY